MNEHFTPEAIPASKFYPLWPEINIERQKMPFPIGGMRVHANILHHDVVALRTTLRILWQKQYYLLRCTDSKIYSAGMNLSIHMLEFIKGVYHAQVFFYPPGQLMGTPRDMCLDPDQRSEGERLLDLSKREAMNGPQ